MEEHQDLQLIVHVGAGLQDVAQFSGHWEDFAHAKKRVADYLEPIEEVLADGKSVLGLVAPETLRSSQDTLLDVLKTLARTKRERQVLSLTLFSEDILGTLLGCMYDLDLSGNVVVLLHARGERASAYTVYRLDEEACLIDWPYGALTAHVERAELVALGFPEMHEIHQRRDAAYPAKLKAKGVSGEQALTDYRHADTA